MAGAPELWRMVEMINGRFAGHEVAGEGVLTSLFVRGRRLLWDFGDHAYQQHLGLSGFWAWVSPPAVDLVPQLLRQFDFPDLKLTLSNWDAQPVGSTWVRTTPEAGDAWLAEYGEDLLGIFLGDQDYAEQFRKKWEQDLENAAENRRALVANYLVDYRYNNGMCNYLRSEVLYQAKIDPHRPLHTLTPNDGRSLWKALRDRMLASYKAYGYPARGFVLPDGRVGSYKPLIFERPGAQSYSVSGRTIYWNPQVQH